MSCYLLSGGQNSPYGVYHLADLRSTSATGPSGRAHALDLARPSVYNKGGEAFEPLEVGTMRRRAYGRDTELSIRMFAVMFLLAAVYLFFLTVLWASGVSFIFIVVIAAVMLGVQYYFSDKMVLMAM